MTPVVQADRWRRVGKALAIIGTFVAAGPLIGLITFAAATALFGVFTGNPGDYASAAAAVLIYGLLFAHFLGAVPAVLTGVTVSAMATIRRSVVPVWFGTVVGGAASALMLKPDTFEQQSADVATVVTWLIVAAGAASGAICTRLTRRWH